MSGCATGNYLHRAAIVPELTAAQLLENYPELEVFLLEYSSDLKNASESGLIKTLAATVTLQQLADINGRPVLELVTKLKELAGAATGVGFNSDSSSAPDWFGKDKIAKTLDAREILASGGHPLGMVLSEIPQLSDGQVFELVTPFLPEPLIARMGQEGYQSWSSCDDGGLFHNYFLNREES